MMTIRFPRSPLLGWMAWALLTGGLLGVGRPAWADETVSPLAEMRTAAETLAEVEPGPQPRSDIASAHKARTTSPGRRVQGADSTLDPLQTAMQDAAQAEVARELAAHAQQRRSAGGGKATGASNQGKDARDEAHGAAVQAQGAKVIGAQHSQGLAKGQGKAPMRNSLGNGSGRPSAAGGALRPK